MKDYLELSPTPTDEPCAMLGTEGYSQRARLECRECRVFIHQLERTFPEAINAGLYFRIKANGHDFGTYYEVQVIYNDANPSQIDWAYTIEGELPEHWDEDAKNELAAHGYDAIPA